MHCKFSLQLFSANENLLLHVICPFFFKFLVNPRPANFRVRNEGGFGERWLRNSNTAPKATSLKANLVSEHAHPNFNIARSRVALNSSSSSTRNGIHRYYFFT
jgi:hypothetical protein